MKKIIGAAFLATMIISFAAGCVSVGTKALAHFDPNSFNNSEKVEENGVIRCIQYEQDFMQALNDFRQKENLEIIVTSDLLEQSVEMLIHPTEEMRNKSMGEKRKMCPHPCFDIYTMSFEKDIYGDWSAEKLFKALYQGDVLIRGNFESDIAGKDMAFRICERDTDICVLMLSTSDRYIERKEEAEKTTIEDVEARFGIELS